MLPVQSVDDVVTTTPPGSPPVMPSRDDGRQNTDDIDTEEYEDSISDNNTINGDNIPLDNEPFETDMPADNITECNTEHMNGDNTTDTNVGNILPQCTMISGDETLNTNADTNRDVTNGHNKEVVAIQNEDTNGHNVLDTASTPRDDSDMNSHNKNELISSTLVENRVDRSSLPHSGNISDVPEESPIKDPHQEIRVYGTVKVHNQVLDLWLYETETRKTYVSVPKMSDEDIQ